MFASSIQLPNIRVGKRQAVRYRSSGHRAKFAAWKSSNQQHLRASISSRRLHPIRHTPLSRPLHSKPDYQEVESLPKTRSVLTSLPQFPTWTSLASRHKVMTAIGVAFVLCNMDKVNMSIAIIPMAREFGWSATVSGLVQSSFFYGYALCQLPGGFLNTKYSGGKMLPLGVNLWSLATAGVPLLGGSVAGLCVSRTIVGMGEAVAPASLTDMVSSVVPVTERSRAMTFVGGGLYLGSILGLLLSPFIVERFGWPYVFYAFGGLGIVWALWWGQLLNNIKKSDPITYSKLLGLERIDQKGKEIPWRAMLRSTPLRALIYTHFCSNWFNFSLMAWLPTYFTHIHNLNLTHAAQISLLPPIAGIIASTIAGPIADHLISKGWKVGIVRKMAQCTAFLGPFLCLLLASIPPFAPGNVFLITAALGLSGFSLAGLYCNHQDLSPTCSSMLLGITSTAGAIPGILGVLVTGALLDCTRSWPLSLFLPSMFFFLTGSIIFTIYGRGEEASFTNNAPFPVENLIRRTFNLQVQTHNTIEQASRHL